jgi:hypothetical protein
MSTLKLDTIASRDGTESTDVTNVINGSAKAWVTYNGATNTINGSFNVDSVTDNASGDFSLNFTSGALADGNYAYTSSGRNASAPNTVVGHHNTVVKTSSAFRIYALVGTGTPTDFQDICVVIHR